jgi:hypothetical protein
MLKTIATPLFALPAAEVQRDGVPKAEVYWSIRPHSREGRFVVQAEIVGGRSRRRSARSGRQSMR